MAKITQFENFKKNKSQDPMDTYQSGKSCIIDLEPIEKDGEIYHPVLIGVLVPLEGEDVYLLEVLVGAKELIGTFFIYEEDLYIEDFGLDIELLKAHMNELFKIDKFLELVDKSTEHFKTLRRRW